MYQNDVKLKRMIIRRLKDCGIAPGNLGYKYLQRAIELGIEDESMLDALTKCLYPAVAKEFSTTASRVERSIRHAIESAFNIPQAEAVLRHHFGNAIDYREKTGMSVKIPNGIFIATMVEEVQLELMDDPEDSENMCGEYIHRMFEETR